MILLKIQVCKYKPEYYDDKKQIRKDIAKIFDFKQHGRTYNQIWPLARKEYGLIECRLVLKENENALLTYYHTTFWKDKWPEEQFWEKYLKSYIEVLEENKFQVKIIRKEIKDDRLWKTQRRRLQCH